MRGGLLSRSGAFVEAEGSGRLSPTPGPLRVAVAGDRCLSTFLGPHSSEARLTPAFATSSRPSLKFVVSPRHLSLFWVLFVARLLSLAAF